MSMEVSYSAWVVLLLVWGSVMAVLFELGQLWPYCLNWVSYGRDIELGSVMAGCVMMVGKGSFVAMCKSRVRCGRFVGSVVVV